MERSSNFWTRRFEKEQLKKAQEKAEDEDEDGEGGGA